MARFFTWIIVGFVVWSTAAAAEVAYPAYRPDLPAGAGYHIDVLRLHPTQFVVGLREVAYKTKAIDKLDASGLLAYLQDKDVPVVIGPGGVPYMTDGHHTLSALIASRHTDKTVYGHILANWATLPTGEFWKRMQAANYTFLRDAAGVERAPDTLPASLTGLQPDAYRGLAWGVMKAGGFKEIKPPALFFQEFFWAAYFRTRVTWDDTNDEAFAAAVRQAVDLAHAPDAATLPGYLPAAK